MATSTKPAQHTAINGIPLYEGSFAAIDPESEGSEWDELMAENLLGESLRISDLTTVTFPRETPAWEVPDPGGARILPELVGVPLRQSIRRAFYAEGYESGAKEAPDCSSNDGVTGERREDAPFMDKEYGGACSTCPFNQWESDLKGGRGKACREYRSIALLEPDSQFPMILRLPPTQLRPWRDLCAEATKLRLPISRLVVRFGIKKDRNDNLFLEPVIVGALPSDTARQLVDTVMPGSASLLGAPATPALPAGDPGPSDDDMPF